MENLISKFKHRYPFRVRTFHVDRQNVVHNIWYFYFFEEARVEYVRELGMQIDEQTFVSHDKFFVVKNSCEYAAPAYYNEELILFTRIAYVKNSSISFEHLAVQPERGLVARADHILVSVDERTNLPRRVPEDLRGMIARYEGVNAVFIE